MLINIRQIISNVVYLEIPYTDFGCALIILKLKFI